MQLELLAARLRHRSSYEATDLGLALLRRFAGPTYVAWFAVTAPLHLALILSLEPGWACLAAWWLRPAFDLVVLFVLSRALFGAVPDLRAVFATLPALAPIALHRVTWKRLDPPRAYASPAEMLEGLRGAALGKRALGHMDLGVVVVGQCHGGRISAVGGQVVNAVGRNLSRSFHCTASGLRLPRALKAANRHQPA